MQTKSVNILNHVAKSTDSGVSDRRNRLDMP